LILLPFAWLPFSLIINNKNYGNVGWIAELNGSKERLAGATGINKGVWGSNG
jgi:hypothetical protein